VEIVEKPVEIVEKPVENFIGVCEDFIQPLDKSAHRRLR
jgi:hypothetical protein